MKYKIRYGGSSCDDKEYKAVMKSVNKGHFKKGHKALPGVEKGWIKEGQNLSPKTQFKRGSIPVNWKGEKAGYAAKHIWISNKRGRPHYCEHCKRSDLKHRQYHWANISGKYKRDVLDYIRLCAKCHRTMDFPNEKHE